MITAVATECRKAHVVFVSQGAIRYTETVQEVVECNPARHACDLAPTGTFALFYVELPPGTVIPSGGSIWDLVAPGEVDTLYYLAHPSDVYDVERIWELDHKDTAMLLRYMRDNDCVQVVYCSDGDWHPFYEGFDQLAFS